MRNKARPRWAIGAIFWGALVLVVVALGEFVAEGEARGHVFFHLASGLIILGLFVTLALVWHPIHGTAKRARSAPWSDFGSRRPAPWSRLLAVLASTGSMRGSGSSG